MKQAVLPHEMDIYFDEQITGDIVGKVKNIEDKEDYQLLILEECIISLSGYTIPNQDKADISRFYSNGIKVYNNSHIDLKIGNTISISGDISKFQKASNPGQFDEYQYNKILKYDYKVYCETAEIIGEEYSVYHNFLHNIKIKIFNVYDTILPSKNAGVLSAMILGDKASLDPDIKDLYQTHGISHILSISGLHVSLIGMALYKLLRSLGLNISLSTLLSIIFIYSYGLLTNFSVSTSRAIIMLCALLISHIIGRTYDLISAASLSALIILINNPLQTFSTGFLLSYGAVLAIGLIYPSLQQIFKIKNKFLKSLVDSTLFSLSVQIMTLPILLYFFFELSTYSILFNIILIPFVSLIIILAIIGGVLGVIYLPLASFFLGGAYYILNFYEWILNIANRFPLHTLVIGRPEATLILTYYIILFLFILLNYWKQNTYSHLILILLLIVFIPSANNNMEVTFLDVGQGDGIFIESNNGTTYLVDGGSSSEKQVGKHRIIPFLKSKGITKLDYVFISHLDEDHINGIIEIIDEMDPETISGNVAIDTLILPKILEDRKGDIIEKYETTELPNYKKYLSEDQIYERLITNAEQKGVNLVYMQEGDYIKEGDILIKCLHPEKDRYYFDKNSGSLVISVNYDEFDMLLTGDIEGIGEDILNDVLLGQLNKPGNTEEYNDLENIQIRYDILKVAHHGSKNSTYNEFLNITNPRYSIISAGKNNSYGHPHEDLLLRLDNVGSKVYDTISGGAITVYTDGKNMQIKSYRSEDNLD